MRQTITRLYAFAFVVLLLGFYPMNAQERIAILQEPNVVLLDPDNGDILDPSFIDLTPLDQGTPKAILQVGEEIWITDQIRDRIDRFDLDGDHLGQIGGMIPGGGLDNIRGLAIVNGSEVWVTNAGDDNDAPGDAIVRFDFDGNNLGFFSTEPQSVSPFSIVDNGDGEVYISYSSSDNIERRDYDGNFLGNIVEPGVVNFIQQIELLDGNQILAAVFSGAGANGVYVFSETDGSILNFWNEGSLRGVASLGNGEYLWSSSGGFFRLNPDTGVSTQLSSDSAQYFGRLELQGCTPPPTPTGDSEQTFEEGATLADIVIDPVDVTWYATEADALAGTNPLPLSTVLVDGETYYAVNIVDGCLSDPFAVTVIITLSANDFNSSNFSYYPNPTDGIITLKYEKPITEITVINMLGQKVLTQKDNALKVQVDLSTLPSATYFMNIISDGDTKTIKVLKR